MLKLNKISLIILVTRKIYILILIVTLKKILIFHSFLLAQKEGIITMV